MVLEAVICKHFGCTQQIQRFGKTSRGTQRYRCGDCQRTFVAYYTHKACDPAVQAQLTQMAIYSVPHSLNHHLGGPQERPILNL